MPALPSIEILVSTMNRTQPPVVLPDALIGGEGAPEVLVINQCTEIAPPAPLERPGMRMLSFAERGLSRSRNRALDAARGDIVLIADDDLMYLPTFTEHVRRAFAQVPDAAVVTFQCLDSHDGKALRSYPAASRRHTRWSVTGVSSVEIALARAKVGNLRFDPAFGLGAEFASGEEAIFLTDALRRGLPVYYRPQPICAHPGAGSGRRAWPDHVAVAKGAVARRLYPSAWPAALVYLTLAKRSFYAPQLTMTGFLRAAATGARRASRQP